MKDKRRQFLTVIELFHDLNPVGLSRTGWTKEGGLEYGFHIGEDLLQENFDSAVWMTQEYNPALIV